MNTITELKTSPINELKDEHQAVKVTLTILGEIALRLSRGQAIDLAHLDQLLEFLTTFVDKCHHGKEEDLLFPELEKAGVPREGGPIGVMFKEHDLGRSYIRGLQEGLTRLKAGDPKAARVVVENIENYSDLLIQHINKEDHILYPMAEKSFSPAQNQALLDGFAEIEEQRVGAGKHEEFHRMLHRLQEIYA
ncbi:MAG: hemerythrin domain-containing protein [Bacteroidota bacterium]